MKITIRLIIALLIAAAAVAALFSWSQVKSDRELMEKELDTRANVLAEGFEEAMRSAVLSADQDRLKALVDRPNIEIGDYTYYDDPDGPDKFVERCVLHHYDFIGDRLVIGKFCAIAEGAQFIMNGANHAMSGFSTYPFNIFGHGWEKGFDPSTWTSEMRGDTVVGHDVWVGMKAVT